MEQREFCGECHGGLDCSRCGVAFTGLGSATTRTKPSDDLVGPCRSRLVATKDPSARRTECQRQKARDGRPAVDLVKVYLPFAAAANLAYAYFTMRSSVCSFVPYQARRRANAHGRPRTR